MKLPELTVLPYQISSAQENMLIDQSLLKMKTPVLRCYGWNKPTLSFGKNKMDLKEIDQNFCKTNGIDLIERITGGKTVFHHHELTYCFASPNQFFPKDVKESYRIISDILLKFLHRYGIKAAVAQQPVTTKSTICFQDQSFYEITVNGKKIIGSAQYRCKSGFLQHGSILLDINWNLWKKIWKISSASTFLEKTITFWREQTTQPYNINELTNSLCDNFIRTFSH